MNTSPYVTKGLCRCKDFGGEIIPGANVITGFLIRGRQEGRVRDVRIEAETEVMGLGMNQGMWPLEARKGKEWVLP